MKLSMPDWSLTKWRTLRRKLPSGFRMKPGQISEAFTLVLGAIPLPALASVKKEGYLVGWRNIGSVTKARGDQLSCLAGTNLKLEIRYATAKER